MISIFNGRSRSLDNEKKNEVFIQVQVTLREHLHLFKGAKLSVLMAIALHSDERGWSFPSVKLLKKETGYNEDTIFEALKDLCTIEINNRKVLLRRSGRGGFDNNRYLIFPDADEVAEFDSSPPLVPEKSETTTHRKNLVSGKPRVGKIRDKVEPSLKAEPFLEPTPRDAHTHTPPRPATPGPAAPGVCASRDGGKEKLKPEPSPRTRHVSEHADDVLADYAQAHALGYGWQVTARRTGEHDGRISAWLARGRVVESKMSRTEERLRSCDYQAFYEECVGEPCRTCFGCGQEVVPGKGARRCPRCEGKKVEPTEAGRVSRTEERLRSRDNGAFYSEMVAPDGVQVTV